MGQVSIVLRVVAFSGQQKKSAAAREESIPSRPGREAPGTLQTSRL